MDAETIIIGAGISGLAAGLNLQAVGRDFLILEARDRVGGRAHGLKIGEDSGIDLGPSWIWPKHQPRVHGMVSMLGMRLFEQYELGETLYDAEDGVQRVRYPHRYGDARRIAGGPASLALAMAEQFASSRLRLGAEVVGLDFQDWPGVQLADGDRLTARHIIAAVPPRLIPTWTITPSLPPELDQGLSRWPTWMAAHAKFVARYERPFWREAGLSGSALSPRGPLMEVVDHSDDEVEIFALFGFVGWPVEQRRPRGEDGLTADAVAQLARLFGAEALNPLKTHLKDWAIDPFAAGPGDQVAPDGHPRYGEPALQRLWYEDRLAIAGAEADGQNGGLIEGALAAADAAVKRLGLMRPAA